MKNLQFRLELNLIYPIKDLEVEDVNEALIEALGKLIRKEPVLVDNVESAMFDYPGSVPDQPLDLSDL